jgi:murein DD-endopeptidase MepM/ murein hydrolase activator NlpD
MSVFPLPNLPDDDWGHGTNIGFGSGRVYQGKTLLHGACDLIAKAGTKVLAVEDGTVIRKYSFAHYTYEEKKDDKGKITQRACDSLTYAVEVQHANFIVRYGEIAEDLPSGVGPGTPVTEGQHIASVGLQCGAGGILGAGSMLHFEMFQHANDLSDLSVDTDPKYLYVKQASYHRRKDLLDPTLCLYKWATSFYEPVLDVLRKHTGEIL